jgi:hypothetical protein
LSGPPDAPVFFTDRDLGKRFPSILLSAGLDVRRHGDLFAHDCPDETWLEHVGSNGWIAITHDRNIRYKPNEKLAVLKHGVRLLVVVGKAPYAQLAESFVGTLGPIQSFIAGHSGPWIAKVYRPPANKPAGTPGSVAMWLDSA